MASTVALIITGALLPGFSATSWWAYAAVAAAAGLVGLVLRPVLVEISARVGWLAVLLTALVGQALIMYVAIRLVPGIESTPVDRHRRHLGQRRRGHAHFVGHHGRYR